MSPKHPKAVMVFVFVTLLEFIHATHFLSFLWEETPGWARTIMVALATHANPSALSLVLGFSLGIGFMILGPYPLKWLLAKLWPNHADEKPRRRPKKVSDKSPRRAQRQSGKSRPPKSPPLAETEDDDSDKR